MEGEGKSKDNDRDHGKSEEKGAGAPADPAASSSQDWRRDLVKIVLSKHARITAGVLVALVVGRVGLNWWLQRSMGIATRTVKVAELRLKTMDKTLNLPGNVEAIEEATLFAHVSGYLKKIVVDEGDKVTKNQLLAIIDAPDILQEFRNAKADYDFKEITRKRYAQLLKEQVVSQQEYDKVDADANQAKARFDNANSNVEYLQVRAPFAGSIARRFRYPGDFISAPTKGGPPSPLFLLVNEQRLRIVVNVPQKEVASVAAGRSVDIRVDTFAGESFQGTISRVDAQLDEATKTQRILIDIDNPEIRLRAGMYASVVLHVEHKENVPMILKDAVHEDGGKSFVFIVEGGHAKKVPITIGEAEEGLVEISAPTLTGKDQIVVGGGGALADGDVVKVGEDAGRVPQQEQSGASIVPRKIAEEHKE